MLIDDTLGERLRIFEERLGSALRAHSRSLDEIELIIVTKNHSVDVIEQLIDKGYRNFGENKHQEAHAKAEELSHIPDILWNFVGQIQSNKILKIVEYANVLHSIDRAELVTKISTVDCDIRCFLQINLSDDPRRGGVLPSDVARRVEQILETPQLTLLGVMAVAPLGEDPSRAFERARHLSLTVRQIAPEATGLSMGMSHDFEDAIAQGATHLRIGTAITGIRPSGG